MRFDPARLAQLRRNAGLSREQLAVAIGRSYPSIGFYERGHVVPPVRVLMRLAEVLDANVEDFFEERVDA